jgi:hypothetical protein
MTIWFIAANVVLVIGTIVLTYVTFRLAQDAASVSNLSALRQGPQPATAAEIRKVEAKRFSWVWLLLAMAALGLLVSYIRPWRYLPVQNPTVSARLPFATAVLELDLEGRRLEEGDSFLAVLQFSADPSVRRNCEFVTRLAATLDAPSADLSAPRKGLSVGNLCASSLTWVVAPKHAGRLVVIASIRQPEPHGLYLEIGSFPISVQVEQLNNVNIILSGLVPLIVGALGFLTPNKRA